MVNSDGGPALYTVAAGGQLKSDSRELAGLPAVIKSDERERE